MSHHLLRSSVIPASELTLGEDPRHMEEVDLIITNTVAAVAIDM